MFVVVDQYEELPELNISHGTGLQRVVNSLVKARDPVVFLKIGARTHDWGKELRIWGAESRIEMRRDYVIVDLNDVLMRREHTIQWLFPKLAADVALKRMHAEGYKNVTVNQIKGMFSIWKADREARQYIQQDRIRKIFEHDGLTGPVEQRLSEMFALNGSPLEAKLASAWVLQRMKRRISENEILERIDACPWLWKWWRKERVEVALIQLASLAKLTNVVNILGGGRY